MKHFSSIIILLITLCCSFSSHSFAQITNSEEDDQKPARILYLVDVSSSMMYDWQANEVRMQTVGRLLNDITDSLLYYNANIEFGLRLIGSQYPAQRKVCTDTKLEVPFGTLNATAIIKQKVKSLKPYGFTPIAYSLKQAALYDFSNSQNYNYSIILITDGGESCNGDICATMQEMVNKKISFKPYILSLVKDSILSDQYACMGTYINILEQKDFNVAIQKIIGENKKKLHIPEKPEPQPIITRTKPQPKEVKPKVDTPRQVVKPTPQPIVKADSPKAPVITEAFKEMMRLPNQKTIKKYTIIIAEPSTPRPVKRFLKMDFPPIPADPEPVVVKPTPKPQPKDVVTSKSSPKTSVVVEDTPPRVMDIKNETEPSDKTQLKVIFLTKQNRPIYTEPEMTITNTQTKAKRKERRLVQAGSKAIKPIDIAAGSYRLQIGNSNDYTQDFEVQPNQINTVTIYVNQSSLAFRYENNEERPVKEYRALVSNRFSRDRRVTEQPCDTREYYEPASYHVEVNTMPSTMYFLDLEMGVTKIITIPENGTLKIQNTSAVGRVGLFYLLGDAYKHFHDMHINGDVSRQELELLPGFYQIKYIDPNTRKPASQNFRIMSLKDTPIQL